MHPPLPGGSVEGLARDWSPDPVVGVGLMLAAGVYALGASRLWATAGAGHGLQPRHVAAYGAGLLVLAIALISPLDTVSDVLFSAHMIQHELLMLVAAPLLVMGRPLRAFVWAMPRRPHLPSVGRVLGAPVVVLVLHIAVRWLWHVPALFNAALADERIHYVQHLSFVVTAGMFWWTVLQGRFGRAGYGVGVAFVFITMIQSGVLAAMLSLGDSPWYVQHAMRTYDAGFDPLADQRRAGLFMWVPAGTLMTGTALALVAAWLGDARRRIARSPHPGLRSPTTT